MVYLFMRIKINTHNSSLRNKPINFGDRKTKGYKPSAVAHGGNQRQSPATGNPSTVLAPQDRAAGGGFIRGKQQRILSLFQAPGFRHGVNLKSKI